MKLVGVTMKSYAYYLYLERMMSKIEKIIEPGRQITPKSLGEEWRKLVYLDPEKTGTQKKYELILNYVERLRCKDGVVAISPGFKNSYFISFLKEARNKTGGGPLALAQGNAGFYDMIYAYQHGIVALAYNDSENSFGHDSLADRMGIPTGELREKYMVGGGIKFDGNKLITSELSGHYGHLWTHELRQGICNLLTATTGLQIEHRIWNKVVTFSSVKPVKTPPLTPYVINSELNFFKLANADNLVTTSQNKDNSRAPCVLL